MERWFVTAKRADFEAIAEEFHISPILARLIRNRDVIGSEQIREYLYGGLESLHDPSSFKDMKNAGEILLKKIKERKKIRIIGDYDIDGINATYILLKGLGRLGADADYDIPERIRDGYGINKRLIDAAKTAGVDTILTCDNGIAASKEVTYAKEAGFTVIVTDHHDVPFTEMDGAHVELIPPADAVVNPKQKACRYPYKLLCGAAVAYKLIVYLYERIGIPKEETYPLLENAAIATIGDVMDLTGENRTIVRLGLDRLRTTQNEGLKALIRINNLDASHLSAYHIGFVIGPCMNASGRLDTAKRALELLLTESPSKAAQLAGDLKGLNDSRKSMTLKGTEKAYQIIENSDLKNDKVLVIYLEECHESLAGIIAGRVRERYNKPVFIITDGEDSLKGSGRSIEAYNMFEEMTKSRDLFLKFGGHPMAAGLSIERERLNDMRISLNEQSSLTDEDFIPKVSIDIPIPISYVSEELIQELELLEPYGKANPKPLFAQKDLQILQLKVIGKNKNVGKMIVESQEGVRMDALYFGDAQLLKDAIRKRFGSNELELLLQSQYTNVTMSFTYYPSVNEYNGKRTLQIVIQNFC